MPEYGQNSAIFELVGIPYKFGKRATERLNDCNK
jgi:hypothetical protein